MSEHFKVQSVQTKFSMTLPSQHPWDYELTFVMPIAPIFSLYEVVPLPDPHIPANRDPNPSIPIPLFTACSGGGGAPDILAHA